MIGLHIGVEEHKCITIWSSSPLQWYPLQNERRSHFSCHQAGNKTIRWALVSGGVPSVLEPVGDCREDVKKPDGMTLIPWEEGHSILWNFVSCNTVAQSHRTRAERGPGEVVNYAEEQKRHKYTPVESVGTWGKVLILIRSANRSKKTRRSLDQHPFSYRDL